MVGWYHLLNGHELGQTLGDGEGTGKPDVLPVHGVTKGRTRLGNSTTRTGILPLPALGVQVL